MNSNKSRITLAVLLAVASGAATAATVSNTMTVTATITQSCTLSPTSTLSFGDLVAGGSDVTATSSGVSLLCTKGSSPKIYSASDRKIINGTEEIPFNLSLTSGASADDLPTTAPTETNLPTTTGEAQVIPIYGRIPAANYLTKTAGAYSGTVVLNVDY